MTDVINDFAGEAPIPDIFATDDSGYDVMRNQLAPFFNSDGSAGRAIFADGVAKVLVIGMVMPHFRAIDEGEYDEAWDRLARRYAAVRSNSLFEHFGTSTERGLGELSGRAAAQYERVQGLVEKFFDGEL